MKQISTLLLALSMLLTYSVFAQCPGSMTASAVTTAASCPSSGSVTISTSPAATASFTYTLTAGPAGALLNTPQASNVFNALLPGSYTVQVSCGAVQANTSFVINNSYTPITNVSAIVTGVCGSYSPGGNISISVTGGSAPFTYSIIKSNDPNYSDALSVYDSSPNKTLNSFGTYQVRVKDACNQFYTVTKQILPSLNPVIMACTAAPLTGCSPAYYNFYCQLLDAVTGREMDSVPYKAMGGVKLRVFEQAPGSCAPTGPLLMELTPAPTHGQIIVPVVSSNKYFLQTITPCGDTLTNCMDAGYFYTSKFSMTTWVEGCGSAGNPLMESIVPFDWGGLVFPLTVNLYSGTSAAGVLAGTKVANNESDLSSGWFFFTGLTPGTYYMTATDACGHVFTQLIDDPTGAGAPSLVVLYGMTPGCAAGAGITTQSGTGSFAIGVQGFLANLATATATIIAGPSNIGVSAYRSGGTFVWINLLPGTYTAAITTTCGIINLQFTIPNNPFDILSQNITAASSSTCGAGSGVITATTDYNGGLVPVFVLTNALTNAAVDSNTTGLFTTVMPGQYYVRMKLSNTSAGNCMVEAYYINSNTVTIAAAGAGPQIMKKLGVTCEDASGSPLTTGAAYLSIVGGSPLLVEYKLTSASTWITFSSNAPQEFSIPGLTAGSIYDIRITSCGITNATQVTIDRLGQINDTNTLQPCVGSAYELSLPELPGAVYEWKNAAGAVISASNKYNFGIYNNTYDGIYTATITWGSCTKRTDTVVLNSTLCGTFLVLPVQLSMFTARAQNCAVTLNWKTAAAADITEFIIERSADGKSYTGIGNVIQNGNSNYMYTDNSQQQGNTFYRLKMKDTEGRSMYSNTLIANSRCNSAGTQWSVYPSLVTPGSTVTLKLNTTSTTGTSIRISISSITGQQMNTYEMTAHTGQNSYLLPDNKLAPGTYLICIYDNKGQRIGSVQKLVYSK